jgi:hypothetical protein
MNLRNQRELDATREKLRGLEEQYEAARSRGFASDDVRQMTLRSLKKLINQLKEEIVRCEAHLADTARSDS